MKRSILHFFLFSFLILSLNYAQTTINDNFEFDGVNRNYIIFLPQNYAPNMPVVFNLHGYTDDAQWQMEYSLMNDVADTAGFIVVYPNAVSPGFNTGLVYGNWPPLPTQIDDVGFISELIDTIIADYNADKNRIYCCGLSNGGMMTLKLAVQLGHRFAAFGNVAGVFLDPIIERYHMVGTLPMLTCNGTDDVLVHFSGGPYHMMWSVEETIGFWVQNNNCNPYYTSVMLPDIDSSDGCTVEKRTYKDFSNNTQIVFYNVIDGGHSWPDANPDPSFRWPTEGNVNRDINMNAELWDFFRKYENPLVDMACGKSMDIYPQFIELSGGTVNINAQLHNPENHDLKVYAHINGDESVVQDSIELFDDGLHNDGNASDNNWGGRKFLSSLQKDYYKAALYTNDLNTGTIHLFRFEPRFTTVGPIFCKDYFVQKHSDSLYSLKLTLENKDSTLQISNVKAVISTTDNRVKEILSHINPQFYPNIEPGQSVQSNGKYAFKVEGNPEIIKFTLEIFSGDYKYWADTITIDLVTDIDENNLKLPSRFLLEQNYPNPFNPNTTIKYQIPSQGRNDNFSNLMSVRLVVYDVLGKEVATLINKKQKPGYYEVLWNPIDLSSGVYFYKLSTENGFSQTKKLVLLK